MKHFSFFIGLLSLLCCATASYGQAPAWQRAVSINQTGGNTFTVSATAADGAGNVYVAGNFSGTVTFGSVSLTAISGTIANTTDVFVAKWSLSSNAFVWAVQAGGTDSEVANDLVFSGGSVYLTGAFRSSNMVLGPLLLSNASAGLITKTYDVFVAKLRDNGTSAAFTWAQQAGGLGNDQAVGLAVSGSSVYVAGLFASSSASFGNAVITNASGSGSTDAFVAKLTDSGASAGFAWARQAGGPDEDGAVAVAAGVGGAVYVTGAFIGTASFGTVILNSSGSNDVFVAKLTDAGTIANFNWVQQAGGSSGDGSIDLVAAGSTLYLTGNFLSTTARFGSTTLTQTSSSTGFFSDVFVAKMTDSGATGSFVWAVKAGGTGDDRPWALVVNGPRLYVAGVFDSPTAAFGATTLTNAGTGTFIYDAFVAKLTDAGSTASFDWAQRAGGSGNDYGNDLAVSGTNLFVAGFATVPASFGSIALPGTTGNRAGFLASLTDPTLTTATAARGSLSFSLAPNPARATATVQLPAVPGAATATLTLTDALGRTLRTETVALISRRYELDVRGLAPGLYAVQVQVDGTRGVQRLVVE